MSKNVQTGKNKFEQIQGSPSSMKSTPQDSSYESYESVGASALETDHPKGDPGSNLPKVFFAEWLCLDQFHSNEIKYTFDNNNTNLEDSNDILLNESEMHPKCNTFSVDDMLQLKFGFEDQISGGGLGHFFPELEISCCDDQMYM